MRAPRVLAAVAVAVAAATAISASPADARSRCAGANDRPTHATVERARTATLCLLNAERRKRRLPRLRENSRLRSAAKQHSKDMERRGFFDHVTPGGITSAIRIRETGYMGSAQTWFVGENLAWGERSNSPPAVIFRAWMKSAGHRANMLNRRYRDVGIGIVIGTPFGTEGATYTTNFGVRA